MYACSERCSYSNISVSAAEDSIKIYTNWGKDSSLQSGVMGAMQGFGGMGMLWFKDNSGRGGADENCKGMKLEMEKAIWWPL